MSCKFKCIRPLENVLALFCTGAAGVENSCSLPSSHCVIIKRPMCEGSYVWAMCVMDGNKWLKTMSCGCFVSMRNPWVQFHWCVSTHKAKSDKTLSSHEPCLIAPSGLSCGFGGARGLLPIPLYTS